MIKMQSTEDTEKLQYYDTEHKDSILQTLNDCKTSAEIYSLINRTFPDWILKQTNEYSKDYPHLQANWKEVCKRASVTPESIVIVDYINFTDRHTVLKEFCEVMTKAGYCVRRREEFISCENCHRAIPVKALWEKFRSYNIPCPNNWSQTCRKC